MIGKFLSLKTKEQCSKELCDSMFQYLQMIDVKVYNRNKIISCLIEKIDLMMPGFCDTDAIKNEKFKS